MKKFGTVIAAISALFLINSCNTKMTDVNPLLVSSDNPYEAPAFDKIKNEHYKPAFEEAIKEGRSTDRFYCI